MWMNVSPAPAPPRQESLRVARDGGAGIELGRTEQTGRQLVGKGQWFRGLPACRGQRIPPKTPLIEEHAPASEHAQPGAFHTRPTEAGNDGGRRPAPPTIDRAHDHVLEIGILRRVQDDVAPRRPVEDDEDFAGLQAGAMRMRTIGETIGEDGQMIEDIHRSDRLRGIGPSVARRAPGS
jgi:hypothetical protein